MIDPMFGIQQYDTFTVFLLKILWYGCPTWKCRSRSWRKRLPILVVTFLSNGGLNHMMFLFRWRFPLKGHCTGVQCVVYKATISAPNHAEKYYYGLSEPEFKSRYANHKSSLKYPSKRNTTELSKYYWELRDKGVDKKDIKVDWRIERQAHKYKCGTRRCDLCLTEKLVIALADKSTMLNKRSEIISACPHRTKYRYHKVTKVKMK